MTRPDVAFQIVGTAEPLRALLTSVRLKGIVMLPDVSLQQFYRRILLATLRTRMLLGSRMVVVVVLKQTPTTLKRLVARQAVELGLGDRDFGQGLASSLSGLLAGRWYNGDCWFVSICSLQRRAG